MTKTYACISVFNDAGILQEAMESILPYVDRMIVVDGAYAKFPYTGNNGASDDGTLELIMKVKERWLSKDIILIEAPGKPWETEMEKRTAYFDAMEEGDWMMMIDADERIAFGGERLEQLNGINEVRQFDAGVVLFKFMVSNGKYHYGTCTRIYRKRKGTHYGNTHAHVIYEGGYRWSELHLPIVVEHRDGIRPIERDRQRHDYYASGDMR